LRDVAFVLLLRDGLSNTGVSMCLSRTEEIEFVAELQFAVPHSCDIGVGICIRNAYVLLKRLCTVEPMTHSQP
jgi:hypothetical protein